MLIYFFPGQGSQYAGMEKDVLPAFPHYADVFERRVGERLKDVCQKMVWAPVAPSTDMIQPVLFTINYLAYLKIRQQGYPMPQVCLGHSLGEISALVASEAIDFSIGLEIAIERGKIMQNFGTPGVMMVVNGLSFARVQQLLISNNLRRIDIAGINLLTKIILSGPAEAMKYAYTLICQAGGRPYILNVDGPFHSRYMRQAGVEFYNYLHKIPFAPTKVPMLSSINGEFFKVANKVEFLTQQLYRPIKLYHCLKKLKRLGVTHYKIVGPEEAFKRFITSLGWFEEYRL